MDKKTFYVKDFGCRINQYDSRLLRSGLEKQGSEYTDEKLADSVYVNGCSVTHRASRDVYKYIRILRKKYPLKRIVLTGCTARDKTEDFSAEGFDTVEHFDYVDDPKNSLNVFNGHTRAFVKVQQGCSGKCAYCCIKSFKTPFFQRDPKTVKKEITDLSENHPEIVFCATNFAEYDDIAALVKLAAGMPEKIKRWRFSSFPPQLINQGLIDTLKNDSRFGRHFHIPLQSASEKVLREMKRPYLMKDVHKAVALIKKELIDSAVSLDIIVGFPGETEKDFDKTLSFIKDNEVVKVHLFRYSERPGTEAAESTDIVDEKIISERIKRIAALSSETRKERLKKEFGKKHSVLIEAGNAGYTNNYIYVNSEEKKLRKAGNIHDFIVENIIFNQKQKEYILLGRPI